jgi:hypothetical protein
MFFCRILYNAEIHNVAERASVTQAQICIINS